MLTWYMALLAVIWFPILILSVLILVVFVPHLLQEKRLGVQLALLAFLLLHQHGRFVRGPGSPRKTASQLRFIRIRGGTWLLHPPQYPVPDHTPHAAKTRRKKTHPLITQLRGDRETRL